MAKKISFYLIVLLLALMPLQAFVLIVANAQLNLSESAFFYASLWKEGMLLLLVILVGAIWFKEKKTPKLVKADYAIAAFFVLSGIYLLVFGGSLEQKLAGGRYNLEFFLFYFVVRFFDFDRAQIKKLFKVFIATAFFVIITGLLQVFAIPPSFLVNLGYSSSWEEYLKTGIIPTVELLNPALPGFYRIQSTFPGDIQFASYLLIVVSTALSFFLNKKKKILGALFVLSLLALVFTFTRSAWIGIIFSVFLVIYLGVKQKAKTIGILATTILLVGVISSFIFSKEQISALVWHSDIKNGIEVGSTTGHKLAMSESVERIKENPLGFGLGSAGPASKFAEKVVISESWYLQIAIELGVLGLIIFLVIIGLLFRELYLIYQKTVDPFLKFLSLGLLGALVGLSVSSLFLHTWTDTATAYTFWIFAGLAIGLSTNRTKNSKAENE